MITADEAELKSAGFLWREKNGVRALACAPLLQDGFANGFSTRLGGTSPMPQDALNLAGFDDDAAENIYENRRRFLQLFDGAWTLAAGWQVHGSDVRVVRDEAQAREPIGARGETEHCDALVTDAAQVLVGVKTADCVPILLGDARRRAVAAIHAGWRGTLALIIGKTIERMREEYGTQVEDIRAAIGPAAGACCYEVGHEVIEAFRASFHDADDLLTPTRESHARIDLQRANRKQLIAEGISPQRIHVAPFCTMCRTDLFFSYRREKILHGRVGRLMSVIGTKG
jgi:YfiH family protein